MDIEKTIWKYALRNAAKFGKTDAGRLVGKIIGEEQGLKDRMKEVMPVIKKVVDEVNRLSPDEISRRLEEFPEEEHTEKDIFDMVEVPAGTKVITAFPPDPSKYPHIGHGKAALLNQVFSQKHHGQFYLRFEDTNPELPKKEFYEHFISDLGWLGIKPDKIFYASDHVDYLYTIIKNFLTKDYAYVCTCPQEIVKLSREHGKPCACRKNDAKQNNELFTKMLHDMEEGGATVRLKIDLSHQNSTMRDPTVFRIILHAHPRVGTKYRVWPTYDFQNAIIDGYTGVTHRFRSKEFELRNELQGWIQEKAGFPKTFIYEFGRFNMVGVPSSGRIIREMMEKKELIGWDDPRLHTIVALRRRGFAPEGIRNFLLSTGMTKNETTLTWDDLIMNNKRIIDKTTLRYYFIWNPHEITIKNCPHKTVHLKDHPEREERNRTLAIDGHFLITEQDNSHLKKMPVGSMIRFMDCINFVKDDGYTYHSDEYMDFKNFTGEKMIIHWLPKDGNVPVDVFMPDHSHEKGMGEQGIFALKEDTVIQFERFGFCRLDKKEKTMDFWYTHN
jgi:glutamyl-tRNA synthetase